MANKKSFTKLAVLSLLGIFSLAACSSEVIAKPTGYKDDTIVDLVDENGNSVDVYDNLMKGIYDDIREGSLATDVLDKLLYQYSISVLGKYNKVISDKDVSYEGQAEEITLKQAARAADHILDSTATDAEKELANKFIRDHKAYWSTNADGERVNDENDVIPNDTLQAGAKEIARVIGKWNAIEERIAKAMYKTIKEGAYSERNLFEERSLLISLKTDLFGVETYKNKEVETTFVEGSGKMFKGMLEVSVEEEDVFEHFLHREFYQSYYGLEDEETADEAINYIENEVIPDVYRQLLVEQYLFDEAYYVLGRSVARKVNVIAIAPNANAKYTEATTMLMTKFVRDYVFAKPSSENYQAIYGANGGVKEAFDAISNLWTGVGLELYDSGSADPVEKMVGTLRDYLVTNNALLEDTIDGIHFFKGTEYGDLMEKYASIDADPIITKEDAESTFTGSGTYPKETGLEIETRKTLQSNHVTSGWFVKDGGLGSLPSTITSRLFHNSVGAALDRTDGDYDRYHDDDSYDATRDYNKDNPYVAKVNGKYYLTTTRSEGSSDPTKVNPQDILFYDSGSSTYYVVEIEEAVSSSKLSKTSNSSYATLYDNQKMEEIVNAVAGELATGDTYGNLSKSHWLEEMNLKYHDTVIYDYFKDNFPDLFD